MRPTYQIRKALRHARWESHDDRNAHLETSNKRVIFGTPDAELVRRFVAICLAAESSEAIRSVVGVEVETGSELPLFPKPRSHRVLLYLHRAGWASPSRD